jgi:response regulator NasT
MFIKEILEANNYCVVGEAGDGFEAIEVCRRTHPDFVLMDIKMPILNGLDAAAVINQEELAGFVLLLTSIRDKKNAKKAVHAMGYVMKPVDEDTLIPAIEIAINKYEKIRNIEKEREKLKHSMDERRIIERAKGVLMEKNSMNEQQAHEYMRKLSMDKGCTMVLTARNFLLAYGYSADIASK